MKGIQILLHSLKQVFGNMGAALRISGLLYLAQIVALVIFGRQAMLGGMMGPDGAPGGAVGPMAVLAIVTLLTSLWIVVAWHRYILKVEDTGSVVPAFHGRRILAYLGYSLLIGVILIIPAALLGGLSGMLFRSAMSDGMMPGIGVSLLAMLVVLVPILLISLHLSPLLPAAALGEPLGIGGAWAATSGATLDFLVLAVATAVGAFVLDLPAMLFAGSLPMALGWATVTGWIKMMVGASILTTVYGHYVEKRPLV